MKHHQGHTCCNRQKVKKGLWSQEEDRKLLNYISIFGQGSWSLVPRRCGLQRCGKSCRLRWVNYLRPDLKRGSFTLQEATTIIELHQQLGNKWAKIAKQLPGRTDNEVKNFWNSNLKKKLVASQEKEMMNFHAYLTPMQPPLNNPISFYPNMIKQEDNFSPNPVLMGSNLETQAYNNHNYANASKSEPTATENTAQPPLPAEIAGIDATFMAAPPSPMRYLETLISEIESLIPTTTVSGSFDSYSAASTPPSTSSGSCFLDDAGFGPF